MDIRIDIKQLSELVPDNNLAADAAGRAVSNLIIDHLRKKNANSVHPAGFPKSDYWADAADSVTTEVVGGKAVVTVQKEGVALHYYGGTVLPKKKALAIPLDPALADVWPSEYADYATGGSGDDDATALFWPRGSSHGFIKDTETGDLLWLLVPKATIPEDKTVLPTGGQLEDAAARGIFELLTA